MRRSERRLLCNLLAISNERSSVSASLWEQTGKAEPVSDRFLSDRRERLQLSALLTATSLGIDAGELRGRTILVHVTRQLSAALALLELDGIAGRIVLCPPDLAAAQLPAIMERAGVDVVLHDSFPPPNLDVTRIVSCGLKLRPAEVPLRDRQTEWLLFTSGTTGVPKMAVHSLRSLVGPARPGADVNNAAVWSSFYDIRRYGGLQILLRALTGGGSMLLSDADETVSDFLHRIGQAGVTHISGTPSHWRRALMSTSIGRISPEYIRLSGEIADQVILNNLKTAFPSADISHAFASTEAGVAFDVRDGLAGFPRAWIGDSQQGVEMRIKAGSLLIRSSRCSSGYAGEPTRRLQDDEGFVDTGDMVVLQDERYFFAGRREGVINVGGLKVHPEEVEAVINQHPGVRMSRARPKRSPITGAVVVADIVLQDPAGLTEEALHAMREEILQNCRDMLPAYKVPALLREVPHLELTAAGKLLRQHA